MRRLIVPRTHRAIFCAAFLSLRISANILSERSPHAALRGRFLPELQDHLSPHEADETLTAVIDWGRYAEIFAYDQKHHKSSLPDVSGKAG